MRLSALVRALRARGPKLLVLAAAVAGFLFLVAPPVALEIWSGWPEDCFTRPSYAREGCVIRHAVWLSTRASPQRALDEAEALVSEGKLPSCHAISHAIGRSTYHNADRQLGPAFATCAPGCVDGCYHGVMEEHLEAIEDWNDLLRELPEVCQKIRRDEFRFPSDQDKKILYRQCLHGMGHGLLGHGVADMDRAVAGCRLHDGVFERTTCLGGLYMENAEQHIVSNEDALTRQLPLICAHAIATHSAELITPCVTQIGRSLAIFTEFNLNRALALCPHAELSASHTSLCRKAVAMEVGWMRGWRPINDRNLQPGAF